MALVRGKTIQNPANLEFRIIRPLLTTHPYDSIPYPPKDLILPPYTIILGRAEARALGSARRPVGPDRSLLGLGECRMWPPRVGECRGEVTEGSRESWPRDGLWGIMSSLGVP